MSRRQTIKAFCGRREVQLLLAVVFLPLCTLLFYQWINHRGPVTLEFVGISRPGSDEASGTVATFRLRNRSGMDISYLGVKPDYPWCEAELVGPTKFRTVGGTLMPAGATSSGFYRNTSNWFVLPNGEERVVRCEIWGATNLWQLKLDYREGSVNEFLAGIMPWKWRQQWVTPVTDLPSKRVVSSPVAMQIPNSVTRLLQSIYPDSEWQERVVKTNANGSVVVRMERVSAVPDGGGKNDGHPR